MTSEAVAYCPDYAEREFDTEDRTQEKNEVRRECRLGPTYNRPKANGASVEDTYGVTADGESDVLVVGAGPTGLTLAAQVHALGGEVRIVDRQLDRVHESRALAVQPRTLEVLRGLELAQSLVERGNNASQLRMHAGERVVAVRLFDVGLEDTAFPFLLFISQAETEALLNEHLAEQGINVERGVELVEFKSGEEAV